MGGANVSGLTQRSALEARLVLGAIYNTMQILSYAGDIGDMPPATSTTCTGSPVQESPTSETKKSTASGVKTNDSNIAKLAMMISTRVSTSGKGEQRKAIQRGQDRDHQCADYNCMSNSHW
jgi:hypothetical protein